MGSETALKLRWGFNWLSHFDGKVDCNILNFIIIVDDILVTCYFVEERTWISKWSECTGESYLAENKHSFLL